MAASLPSNSKDKRERQIFPNSLFELNYLLNQAKQSICLIPIFPSQIFPKIYFINKKLLNISRLSSFRFFELLATLLINDHLYYFICFLSDEFNPLWTSLCQKLIQISKIFNFINLPFFIAKYLLLITPSTILIASLGLH